jgi:hypothetical protein
MRGWNRLTGFRVESSMGYLEHINATFVSIENGKFS